MTFRRTSLATLWLLSLAGARVPDMNAAPAHVFRRDTGAPLTRAFGHSTVHRYATPAVVGIQERGIEPDILGSDRY